MIESDRGIDHYRPMKLGKTGNWDLQRFFKVDALPSRILKEEGFGMSNVITGIDQTNTEHSYLNGQPITV